MAFSFTAMFSRVVHHGLLEIPVGRLTGRRAVRRFGLGAIGHPRGDGRGFDLAAARPGGIAVLTGYYMLQETRVTPMDGHRAADNLAARE